jgi:hypothetical protein
MGVLSLADRMARPASRHRRSRARLTLRQADEARDDFAEILDESE